MTTRPVYLDYAATTPVHPVVAQAMQTCLGPDGDFGNPASVSHVYGRQAAARVEAARAQVANLIGAAPEEIVFTSGATESNNLALLGIARSNADRGRHIVTSRIEHKAVLDPCRRLEKEGFSVTYLEPDSAGRISAEAVRGALRPDTILVTVMMANNETGVIQDILGIGAVCRSRNVACHTDAAQAIGKIDVDVGSLPLDTLAFTAHKLYGPKGVGALYVRKAARPLMQAVMFGGGHERGLRPGTLATHQIIGFASACELAGCDLAAEAERQEQLRDRLWAALESLGSLHLNGAAAARLPGLLNVSFEGVQGESLLAGLEAIAVSTGSACNSASGEPSYVLRALGRDSQLAQSSLRFSLGRFTTPADIDIAVNAVREAVRRLRSLSPARTLELSWPATLVVTGEAGGPGQETWIRIHLLICDGVVKDARFQAYGCPHTLAVTAWMASQLAGRTRESLVPGTPLEWASAHGVPVEKLGRLLVIEDAARACQRHWPGRA